MPVNVKKLENKSQTIAAMYQLVKMRCGDLVADGSAEIPFGMFFDKVRKTKYSPDKKGLEIVAAPSIVLRGAENGTGADCKKKAVLIASWLECNSVPWRFVTSSTRNDRKHHHVFVQYLQNGNWINADATYKNYKIGDVKKVTDFSVY